MSRTQRIILIIAIVFAAVGGGLLIWMQFFRGEPATNTGNLNLVNLVNAANINTTSNVNTPVNGNTNEEVTEVPVEDQLKNLARSFTERYGSYSTENNYENLENLKSFMTERFRKETDATIAKGRKEADPNAEYYGISTQVVTVETESFDEQKGTMTAVLTCRRTETDTQAATSKTFTQTAKVQFIKEGARWLVDTFTFING